jgi:hypothetical protein
MKTVIESFKIPSLAGFFVTICDLKIFTKSLQKRSQKAFYRGHKKPSKEVTKGGHCDPYLPNIYG